MHPGCDNERKHLLPLQRRRCSVAPTRLGPLYCRAGCFDSRLFVARRFCTTMHARNGFSRSQPAVRWNSSIRYVRWHFVPNSDCRAAPIGIGKDLGESMAGIACESRRRGQQVAVVESRPTNLLASAMALALGSVRLSQKSHKVAVLLRITLFPRFRWFKSPLRPGVADVRTTRAFKRRARTLLRRENKAPKMEAMP